MSEEQEEREADYSLAIISAEKSWILPPPNVEGENLLKEIIILLREVELPKNQLLRLFAIKELIDQKLNQELLALTNTWDANLESDM